MKKLIIFTISILAVIRLSGQDDAITSQYLINPYYVNPGAAGINDMVNFNAAYRSSLNSLPGHPNTYYASFNGMVAKRVALGALLLNDQIASLNKYRMQLSYAYSWLANPDTRMGLGLSTEFHQINLDKGVGNNPYEEIGDPILLTAIDGTQYFDATVGLYGLYKGKLHFGVTLPNLVRARLNKGTDEELDAFETAFKNYTVNLGYRFDIKDYDFAVEPSIMLRKGYTTPAITDIAIKAYFLQNKLIIGGLARIVDSETIMGMLMGIKFGSLRLFYSYDVSFQNTQKYHAGSHEFSLNFELPSKKKMTAEEEAKAAEEKAKMEGHPTMDNKAATPDSTKK
ncbi:MAG TPA: PorP/SprF family type IX secretion system membrane protein [Saprospiraceae bacterium]|nr:PorP/SprF family type IX secretion system membrane protein [Saprospiraceae bacterium]